MSARLPFGKAVLVVLAFATVSNAWSSLFNGGDSGNNCNRGGSGKDGTCGNPSSCSGHLEYNRCSGGNNNVCCVSGGKTVGDPGQNCKGGGSGVSGVCGSPSSCHYHIEHNRCNGGNNNVCCTKTLSQGDRGEACFNRGSGKPGTCEYPSSCKGQLEYNRCTGGNDNVCCVAGSGGGSNNGGGGSNVSGKCLSALDLIKDGEGFRSCVYKDSVGIRTVCYGFNLERSGVAAKLASVGANTSTNCFNQDQCTKLLQEEMDYAVKEAKNIFGSHCECVQTVLADMTYNLGSGGMRSFKNMISLVKKKDYCAAGRNSVRSSKYCGQVGRRCDRNIDQLCDGCSGRRLLDRLNPLDLGWQVPASIHSSERQKVQTWDTYP